uniref:Uncharacterized protein n=1 Tax=Salmo trutta TaxID=8032 RepID=A0A673WT68_SALTR
VCGGPSCYTVIYVNTTEAALQRNFTKLFELQERVRNGTETESLPPELQPLITGDNDDGSEVNVMDPVVRLFLYRQRRIKEVKKHREANMFERLNRFTVEKVDVAANVSVLFLMTAIAMCNLAVGLPLEQLTSEVAFATMKEPETEANQDEVGHDQL